MTIAEAIQDVAKGGGIRLFVNPATNGGYQANCSIDGKMWRCEMDPDPVVAIEKVLGLRPGASGPMRVPAPAADLGVFE